MKIQTFSIVVGTSACDSDCPFCISHTTGFEILPKSQDINRHNFDKAARLAQISCTTTVLLTGKGEPTLYPEEVYSYLNRLRSYNFPFIEIQTNAIRLGYLAANREQHGLTRENIVDWYKTGLNTIAISVVDVDLTNNSRVYKQDYPDLATTIKYIHDIGFSVRLCVMMQQGMVDNPDKLKNVIHFCKKHNVAQLTVRPIRRPLLPVVPGDGDKYVEYINNHGLTQDQIDTINNWADKYGTHISTLMHGAHKAKIYDVMGQNLCLSDCLTIEPSADDIRTLIFYGSGEIYFDWQFTGARLL